MRIGIDLQVLANRPLTGIGKYALELATHLLKLRTEHRFIFFVPRIGGIGEIREMGGETVELPEKLFPFWASHFTYARIMQNARLDVLHGVANTIHFFYSGRAILTIHDLVIYKHPEWFPKNQWFSTRVVVPRSSKNASQIIVPSQATAKDLQEVFSVPSEKI